MVLADTDTWTDYLRAIRLGVLMTIARARAEELQPTTIERAEPRSSSPVSMPAVDALLLSMFKTVAGARGLLIRETPEGSVVYLIVGDRDSEDAAYEVFARAIGLFGANPPTFVAVPVAEADGVMVNPDARAYLLP